MSLHSWCVCIYEHACMCTYAVGEGESLRVQWFWQTSILICPHKHPLSALQPLLLKMCLFYHFMKQHQLDAPKQTWQKGEKVHMGWLRQVSQPKDASQDEVWFIVFFFFYHRPHSHPAGREYTGGLWLERHWKKTSSSRQRVWWHSGAVYADEAKKTTFPQHRKHPSLFFSHQTFL